MSRAIENASSWRAKHQIPKGVCTWCRGPVPKGSRHWCADKACTTEFLIRRDPTFARARVADRDNGVCRSCGIDTEQIRAELTALRKLVSATYAASAEERERGGGAAAATRWLDLAQQIGLVPSQSRDADDRELRSAIMFGHRHLPALWEMDHIVPVAHGGGGCGLDNLQTLCLRCHKMKTASQAAARAAASRPTPARDLAVAPIPQGQQLTLFNDASAGGAP